MAASLWCKKKKRGFAEACLICTWEITFKISSHRPFESHRWKSIGTFSFFIPLLALVHILGALNSLAPRCWVARKLPGKRRSLIREESGAPAPQIFTLICGFEEDPSESVYSKWAPPAVSRFQRTRTVSHYYFIAAGHLWSRVAGNEKVQRIVSLVEPYMEKGLNYLICYRFKSWYFEDCVIIK